MKRFSSILLFCFCCYTGFSQTVWENPGAEVYPYLYRMAQKGLVPFSDLIQPVSRQQIEKALLALEAQPENLSAIEKKELAFYLQEYRSINGAALPQALAKAGAGNPLPGNEKMYWGRKDPNGRLRGAFVHTKDFHLQADPLGSLQVFSGRSSFTRMSSGLNFWGHAKGFAFQFQYQGFVENGSGIDSFHRENPSTGFIALNRTSTQKLDYSDIKAHISYSWKNGSISLGQDHLLWGYGQNGRMVLSERAPVYPYLRFDYQPLKWLRFQYAHAWLQSNIIDSVHTYPSGTVGVGTGDTRIQYIPKYMATHSLLFTPTKGLDIAIGESIVYSDRMDVGFLIPLNFFKLYDNNRSNYEINAGNNGQFFLSISSRNHLKNTHLYATWFIDEVKFGSMFNPAQSRNQFGYNVGASVTDVFLPYLTVAAEYTRINPFVYSHLMPAQFYTHHNYVMGDWMGNNMDRWNLQLQYTPLPKLRTLLRFQHLRKGGVGSIRDQYAAQPQPGFLFDYQKKRTEVFFQVRYEWLNNLYLQGSYQWQNQTLANGSISKGSLVQLGFSVGLR